MRRLPVSLGLLLAWLGTAEAQAQQAASIPGADGFLLNAMYYAPETPGPGILLLHQCDREGPLTGFEGLADELKAHGFHVLLLDYRTYGKSVSEAFPAGAWQQTGDHMADDVEAAYGFLSTRPGVEAHTMGVGGASCGGRHAIRLAARHEQIKTMVFMSSLVGPAVFPTYRALTHLPVLSVVSEGDPYGSTPESMEAVFAASEHAGSRLVMYKGAAHGTPLFEQDPSLVRSMAAWFEVHLKK